VLPANESADREALTNALGAAIQSTCRVKVDEVQFASALDEGAPLIVDERSWD
jgi:hypothetical protein